MEQLSAALPEQQEDFLSPSLADFDEQQEACDLSQVALLSFPDFASFDDGAFSEEVVPPKATSFVDPSAAVFVLAT
ncbi:MAG: hypothetical protein CMD33_01215 [Flavobacteriales bacterium]|nr:hypothetical protein [Flavobacteriales bacterium]